MPSFFKKPAWANNNSSAPDSNFYKRSDRVYSDILDAERTQTERKKDSEGRKSEKLRRSPVRESKRRRVSGDDEEEAEANGPSTPSPSTRPAGNGKIKPEPGQPHPQEQKTVALRSPSSPGEGPARSPPKERDAAPAATTSNIIDIDDDSPPPQPPKPPTEDKTKRTVNLSDDDEDDDDTRLEEEFPELARKARERARRAAELKTTKASTPDQGPSTQQQSQEGPTEPTADTQDTEPVVEIFVSSENDNVKPLLVRRRLTQSLKDVRRAWCHRRGMSPETAASIFLTWKGKRLFDVTTCQSLGIHASESYLDDILPTEAPEGAIRVHMEAVTEEEYQAKKRQMRATSFAEEDDSDDDEEDEKKEENSDGRGKEPAQILRIILRAPGMEDLRVKVRPTTRLKNIVKTVREMRKIENDKAVHFLFDGDILDPDSVISDSEIADLDCVDLRIK